MVDWKGMRKRAQEIVEELGMDMDVDAPVDPLLLPRSRL